MNSIIIEEAIDMIQDGIHNEWDHIIDMVDNDMYKVLKPPCGLTKYIDTDDLDSLSSFEGDMNQWVSCIDKHSEITIPSGIHANVMQLRELMMDTIYKTHGYRMIIKHMYTLYTPMFGDNVFISIIYGMVLDLKLRTTDTDYNLWRKIHDALDNIYYNTVDMYIFIDGIRKCMSISMQHYDMTKPSGIHADIEIIYRCILNAAAMPVLHEEIAAAAFSPKRVQRMIEVRGMDYLDEM